MDVGGAEEGDLLADAGLGGELADGLLAELGDGVGDLVEEEAGEAGLADGGADGGEEAEEGMGAEEVEVAGVEVVGGRGGAGEAGLGFGAVDAGEGGGVEGEQAGLGFEGGLKLEVAADEEDEQGEEGEEGKDAGEVLAYGLEGEEQEGGEVGEEGGEQEAARAGEAVVESLVIGAEGGVGGLGVGLGGCGHELCRW